MDPVILASARKHGVADDDMLHAHRNPIRIFEVDELIMLVGADGSSRSARPVPRGSSSSSTPCQPAKSS